MANIDQYIQEIQNAVYGEEVRGSIINALQKVNDDNESYQALKEEVIAAKDDVDSQVAAFDAKVKAAEDATAALEAATSTANTAKTNLESATSTANTARTNLTNATSTANTARTNLENATDEANTAKTNAETAKKNLETTITNSTDAKSQLQAVIDAANLINQQLASTNSTAQTSKTNLESAISNATTSKNQLQEVIDNAQQTQTDLSTVINQANTAKEELDASLAAVTGTLEELTTQNSTAASNIDSLRSENFNAREILTGVEDIKAYLGYTDEDIVGIQVDYENRSYQRLAGAYDLTGGEDFNAFEMYGGRRKCNVSDDGTIVAWYGDTDYAEDGSMGQVMVYQPKFYYKVVPLKYDAIDTGIGYHLRKANYYVSTKPKTGFKLHPAFYDANGNEIDYYLTGAYEGSIWDADGGDDGTGAFLMLDEQVMNTAADKFCSIAGVKPASGLTQQLTRPNVELLAKNRGENWHGDLIKLVAAEQLLMIIEMGMMNSQTAIANGVVSVSDTPDTENNSIVTGGTSSLGNGTGQAEGGTNGKSSISYRGVENPWGNIWKFVYGVNIHGDGSQKGGIPYICSDFSFAESKNSDNYESAGFTVANANGYISAMGYSEEFDWLFFPSEATGNSSLPVGDYLYIASNLNGYRIALLGGRWADGSDAGTFYWSLNYGVGYHSRYLGARLVYIPTTTDDSYEVNLNAWRDIMTA